MVLESRENFKSSNRHHSISERLHEESMQLLGGPRGKISATASGTADHLKESSVTTGRRTTEPIVLNGNSYNIAPGDTLSSIARRMLKLRGEATSSRNIYDEVNRIIDLNAQRFPWLDKNPNKIRSGMKIAVWDSDAGPDPSCTWKDWKEAEPGRITVALKCQSIFAGKDTHVVVTPGARAVFTPGSYGFVAPKGFARSLEGSHVTAVGGEVIDDGGQLQVLHEDVKIRTERGNQLAARTASSAEQLTDTEGYPNPEDFPLP